MTNEFIFLFHCLLTGAGALFALYLGAYALVTFITLQLVAANLFVIKPIILLGMTATGSDAFTIGAVFGFHLLQEFYGKDLTKKTIFISFSALLFFVLLGQVHLAYAPAACDATQAHFIAVLGFLPRIMAASLTSYWITQQFDCWFYELLKNAFKGNYLPVRNFICAATSQLFDTCLFSLLGLWGIIWPLSEVIFISYCIKLLALLLITPCMLIARKMITTRSHTLF